MRTLMIGILLLLFAVFSFVALPILWVVGKINDRTRQKISHRIAASVLGVMLFLAGVKKTVIGTERVPRDRAVLFAINHRGYFDIIISLNTVPVLSGFVSKIELKKAFILNIWMDYLKCIFLDRKNSREGVKAILKGIDTVKSGTSVFIAPEGTRNKGEGVLPFKPGSLKIAEKTGCPIVPVAIVGSDAIFENQFPWVKSGRMVIEYGEPIYTDEYSKEEKVDFTELARSRVAQMYEKNSIKT